MTEEDLNRLGADALAVKRARMVLSWVMWTVALGVALTLVRQVTDSPFGGWWLPAGGALVLWFGVWWWWTGVDHARWGWRLGEGLLEVRHGVLIRRFHYVPRNRIQNVTTSNGPFQTRFGVVTLTVHTAGLRTPNVSIRDIDAGHAEAIRRELGLV